MKVRELMTQSLGAIGVKTRGIENQPGNEFDLNYAQLVSIVDQLRLSTPYITEGIVTPAQLANCPFVEIESILASLNPETDTRYYMEAISLADFNKLAFIKKLSDIPKYYYFQKPSTLKVYPNNDNYVFLVTGRANIASELGPDVDLDDLPIPRFYQDYIMIKLAKRLCPFYQKSWTNDLREMERDAQAAVDENTDFDSVINYPGDMSSFLYRPRNFVRNG